MDENMVETLKRALNALEHLRQAEQKLPAASKKCVDEVREHLQRADWKSAKVPLVRIIEAEAAPSVELWKALIDVLDAAQETDINGLLDYLNKNRPKPG